MAAERQFYIPTNIKEKNKLFHLPDRNIIEAAIAEAVLFLIIRSLPFILVIKVVAGAIIMISAGLLFAIGIKNESVTEFIMSSIKFNQNKKSMHLRTPDQYVATLKEEKDQKEEEDLFIKGLYRLKEIFITEKADPEETEDATTTEEES